MIRTVLLYCSANSAATAGIAAFAGIKTTADNKLILIDTLNQLAGTSVKGVTLDTNIIRLTMCNIALKCGDAVSAYASSVNNNTLRQRVTYTITALNKMKKEDVDDVCQTIHDEANANIATAGAFGYDATDVTDLATAINLYRTSMQNPRGFTVSKKQANENIKLLSREIVDNLFEKQMDKMVNTLKTTNTEFVKGYFFSREIINLGSTTAKVRGTVKDSNDVPLVGVQFIIRKTGQLNKTGETLTTSGGKFGISNLSPANYDFFWQFPGYQAITETNVKIAAGKEIKRKITMLPVTSQTITIQGVVRNEEDNTPIPAAVINIGIHTTVSQTDGSYYIQFPPASSPNYPVSITATGYETIMTTYTVQPGQTNTQDILMVPVETGILNGIVTANGNPVPNAFIQLTPNNYTTNANPTGNYEIQNILVGSYTLTVSAPGYVSQQIPIIINANSPTQVNIILIPNP